MAWAAQTIPSRRSSPSGPAWDVEDNDAVASAARLWSSSDGGFWSTAPPTRKVRGRALEIREVADPKSPGSRAAGLAIASS